MMGEGADEELPALRHCFNWRKSPLIFPSGPWSIFKLLACTMNDKVVKYGALLTLVLQNTFLVVFMRYSRTLEGPRYASSTAVFMMEVSTLLYNIWWRQTNSTAVLEITDLLWSGHPRARRHLRPSENTARRRGAATHRNDEAVRALPGIYGAE